MFGLKLDALDVAITLLLIDNDPYLGPTPLFDLIILSTYSYELKNNDWSSCILDGEKLIVFNLEIYSFMCKLKLSSQFYIAILNACS